VPSRSRPRIAFASVLIAGLARGGDEPRPDVATAPGFEAFLVIPLRVHVLRSAALPEVDCGLKDEDVRRVVGKVNRIWHAAGIHWALDPIVREAAAREADFRAARAEGEGEALGEVQLLAPEGSRSARGMDVYYVHRFAANGVFLGDRMAFIQETAQLLPVEGGGDEPLPRVTAHELAHALGLPHRQSSTNLLASGTTGTLLSTGEAERARAAAIEIPGVLAVPDLRKRAFEAAKAKDLPGARRLWRTLAEIPGAGAAEARSELRALGGAKP